MQKINERLARVYNFITVPVHLPTEHGSEHAKRIKLNYGLSVDEYNIMLKQQEGCCAICQLRCKRGRLAVDHDHDTGVVRGLLCLSCNTALGQFRDSPAVLERAFKYLSVKKGYKSNVA